MTALKRLCALTCHDPSSLSCLRYPTSPAIMIRHVASLHEAKLSPSTIASHMSAIRFWHDLHNWDSPTKHIIVQKMLMGARHIHAQPQLRTPVTPTILRALLSAIEAMPWSSYIKRLYMAMYTLAFYAFLRVGEMTHSRHALRHQDCVLHPSAITLTFRSYKFSRGGQTSLVIPAANHDLCPHQHMSQYLFMRPRGAVLLFVDQHGNGVSGRRFTTHLRDVVDYARLSNLNIKPHSFRIGAATTAANAGISADAIQRMGRWSSAAFAKYIRHQINPL